MAQAAIILTDILTVVAEITNKTTQYANGADTALKATFIRGINEGYRKIVKEKYPLDYSESITLDADGCFNPATLTKSIYKIKQIVDELTSCAGYSYEELQRDKIYIPEAGASGTVLVCYYYLPDDLALDNSSPEIPAAIISKEVYAEYAAFYYFKNLKKYGDANYHFTLYDNAISDAFTSRTSKKLLVRRMI